MSKSASQKICYLDFEFNKVLHPTVNLVSCATECGQTGEIKKWWLHKDPQAQAELLKYLKTFDLLIGYSFIAEARSLIALGKSPLDFQNIDLFLEYRMITNHNDKLQWGEQLVDGVVKKVHKPRAKWDRHEGEEQEGFRATHSLAECTFKLLGEIRDTEHKTKMRNLIISAPDLFTPEEQEAILDYGVDDIIHLKRIWAEIQKHMKSLVYGLDIDQYIEEAKVRGRFSAHTAYMENDGYPIDYVKTKNFSNAVNSILFTAQRDINSQFPDFKPFRWKKNEQKFSWNQVGTRVWILKQGFDKWKLTPAKQLSLSLEAFEKYFSYKHDYPRGNFGAQMVRYLKLKQTLYGFVESPDKTKRTFWDFVGPDNMVRPYTNIYGAQSSRSQPSSTGFMMLKPAWMRALVGFFKFKEGPEPEEAMGGIDYSSEEFFIGALSSEDKNMINAYLSGDVYLAFGKAINWIPKEGTKKTHKFMRDVCKNTVLGISYLMSKFGLAIKLTLDTGKEWTEDQAQELIDLFDEVYADYKDSREFTLEFYQENKYLKLPCGWYMFGDNDNFRSATNFYVQGFGASILRKAVDLAVARGLRVVKTLHDAIYIRYKIGEEYKLEVLADCMREAFVFYFKDHMKPFAEQIRLDPFAWSPAYKEGNKNVLVDVYKDENDKEVRETYFMSGKIKVPCDELYIDDRAVKEYNTFSKFFERQDEEDL